MKEPVSNWHPEAPQNHEEAYLMRLPISPRDWGLPPATEQGAEKFRLLGFDREDLENRCRQNTYSWLLRQFNEGFGAFHGYSDRAPASSTSRRRSI